MFIIFIKKKFKTKKDTLLTLQMIPPYEPRLFPLPENIFEQMLFDMPTGHKNLFDSIELPFEEPQHNSRRSVSFNLKSHSSKSKRSNNNNSISYTEDESIIEETIDDDDSDRNSVIERLLLLEKAYDEEKLNNQDNSAAETESVDTLDVPDDEEEEDPNDPEWYEPSMRF